MDMTNNKKSEVKYPTIFFIIGRPRSGTTLLRYLFDAHPNVIIPEECNFLLTLSLKYKETKSFTPETIEKFKADFKGTLHFKSLSIDLNKFDTELEKINSQSTIHDLFNAIYYSLSSIHAKKEILVRGDKNPAYSSELFDKLYPLYPNAKYIHLIRDYHDHIASTLRAKLSIPSSIFLAISWKKSIKRLERYKSKKPQNFYTIRYEDFVENPKERFEEMCQFVEIEYNEDVFQFHENKDQYYSHQPNIDFRTYHQSLFNPVNKSRVGNWKSILTGNELATIEIIAGKKGQEYGYNCNEHKWNLSIIYLLLKWYFLYYVFILSRKIIFLIPLRKRYWIVDRLSKNFILHRIYLFLLRRN
jgi:hypothetical protein